MTTSDSDRDLLRRTFDRASARYQRARPEYPTALYERLLEVTDLSAGSQLLEIGCATGKATIPLAARGFRITGVEIGPALAAAARRNLAAFDNVEIVEAAFENWPARASSYDMVFAATSWHWIDPAIRYQRAADALRSRGFLAFWDGVSRTLKEV